MTAFVIDAFEFCRLGEYREGQSSVADFPRFAKETADASGVLHWSLQGGSNQHGHPQLKLMVAGTVQLTCQRCLKPFAFDVDSNARLVLAPDEASADEIDVLLADEDVEVIVGSRSLDFGQLIEDDALLALPLAPKHDTCPDQLIVPSQVDATKASPFSVLKNLKK